MKVQDHLDTINSVILHNKFVIKNSDQLSFKDNKINDGLFILDGYFYLQNSLKIKIHERLLFKSGSTNFLDEELVFNKYSYNVSENNTNIFRYCSPDNNTPDDYDHSHHEFYHKHIFNPNNIIECGEVSIVDVITEAALLI